MIRVVFFVATMLFLANCSPVDLEYIGDHCSGEDPRESLVPAIEKPQPIVDAWWLYGTKEFALPITATVDAVQNFKKTNPDVKAYFSRNSGELFWLDGNGGALVVRTYSFNAFDITATYALDMVFRFMENYPQLYRIENPRRSLISDSDMLKIEPNSRGFSLKFLQTYDGVSISNNYGIAFFDSTGSLTSLVTRLTPTLNDKNEKTISVPQDWVTAQKSLYKNKHFLNPTYHWEKREKNSRNSKFELVETVVEKKDHAPLIRTRYKVNLKTNKKTLLFRNVEIPTLIQDAEENWTSGRLHVNLALDPLERITCVPSVKTQNQLVMGFKLPEILGLDAFVTVANGQGQTYGSWGAAFDDLYYKGHPIATTEPMWTAEQDFVGKYKDSTDLSVNAMKTLEWFYRNLNHRSWDGNGSTLYTAFAVNPSLGYSAKNLDLNPSIRVKDAVKNLDDKDEYHGGQFLNAYGGWGFIMVGDGYTSKGLPLSNSLDVIAHEFTHSVLTSTVNFEYLDEAGAINESLADLFGNSVEGFNSDVVGEGAGEPFRNMRYPQNYSQPTKYSELKIMSYDRGGVHINSGILNRAWAEIIISEFNRNPLPLVKLVYASLKNVPFSIHANMEEYAATLTAFCHSLNDEVALSSDQAGLCEALDKWFTNTELLSIPY